MPEKATADERRQRDDRLRPRCFLALPFSPEFKKVRDVVVESAKEAGFKITLADGLPPKTMPLREMIAGELARADCVVADLTKFNPNVLVEVGLAQAMGKILFLITQADEEASARIPATLQGQIIIAYQPTAKGLKEFGARLAEELAGFRRSPMRSRFLSGRRFQTPFFVDWDHLDRADAENLCRELLAQMGFQRLDWFKESREIDLVAELPKKDPDGYEYRELWLVSMGHNAPMEMILDMAGRHPEFLFDRLFRFTEGADRLMSKDVPITLLLIVLEEVPRQKTLFELEERKIHARREGPFPSMLRLRVWDRNYLTSLVQQFPQIGYKYFSDEGRAQTKYRKTPEELYQENVDLAKRLTTTIAALNEEKGSRIRAESDAIWKDISFSAAHKIGNPLFAIETNLDPLEKRIIERRTEDALAVIKRIRRSVEKSKDIVDQFKSLTLAQKLNLVVTSLRPLLEASCQAARVRDKDDEIPCTIECAPDIKIVGDPDRLSECFDELVRNSIRWFDKSEKKLEIVAVAPAKPPLPPMLDAAKQYVVIHFRDNGSGIPIENKTKIFDAFFTTHDQGTGLGLALVRRIIDGHGGAIFETGLPNKGADFEIYLPLVTSEAASLANKKVVSPK
jgi:signal transduction histidine kinase